MIELKNVTFNYSNNSGGCLKNINLSIRKGEIIVLTGESGCGKTTVTRLINGLIPHYYEGELNGEIFIDGKDVSEMSLYDISKRVGSVFQNPRSQFFSVDTDSELAFSCENQGMPEEEILERISRVVKQFNIENLMHRSIFDMSGGQKQKIACASVAVSDPDIIVFDEPSSNLDMNAVADLRKYMKFWKEQNKTMIIAEHRLNYLKDIADRVIYIKNGEIFREFTMDELKAMNREEIESFGLRPVSHSQFIRENNISKETEKKFFLRNFNFAYRKSLPILKINDNSVPFDSTIAVIGHNGAGKSTFARCLCGLEKKFKGYTEIDGNRLKRRDRLKKSFMVMQDVNHQLFTESVLEEVLISMQEENESLAIEILRSLDLEQFRDRHPMSLSGGQKQRVAIASAIVSDRDIMLFDEPTSGLDLKHMCETAETICMLRKNNKCVLVISHDLELILRCCTYVVRIENGEIFEQYPLDSAGIEKITDFFESPLEYSE